jgi:hypothetical protein
MKNLAPIVLFAYNRPQHTLQTLQSLAKNIYADASTLIVFCDGAKKDANQEDLDKIAEVRKIVKSQSWCKDLKVIEGLENKGLANSIIEGVSQVVNQYGKIIVLEDDLLTSKYFLKFMNEALNTYELEEKVLSVGACNFFARDEKTPETFFVPIPDCWGWATWNDRWKLFEKDGSKLLAQLKERSLLDDFNLHGAYNYQQMLEDQIAGKNNSWAIRWQAVAYLTGKLSLYPKYAKTFNSGFDSSATHTSSFRQIFDTREMLPYDTKVDKMEVNVLPSVMHQMIKGNALASGKISQESASSRILTFLKRKLKIT